MVSPLLLIHKECAITFTEKLQINEQFKETNKHNKLSRVPLLIGASLQGGLLKLHLQSLKFWINSDNIH